MGEVELRIDGVFVVSRHLYTIDGAVRESTCLQRQFRDGVGATQVCLCMSPLGETFRERLRQFPSLVNCSTIDWFTEWPAEALESVGLSALVEAGQVIPENRPGP